MNSLIYPDSKLHPYYIIAPPYLRSSAGIRALHLLGHALNKQGFNAFVSASWLNPDLLTKPLTTDVIQYHFEQKITPIVVYAETIKGNPYQAPFVVRYILNFPGLLGGDKAYPKSEVCFGYSSELLENQDPSYRSNVLYIPGCDTSIFYPPSEEAPRSGSCFFASKYKTVHNGKTFPITKHSVEITRDLPDSPSPTEIADLLRKSEYFYAYENTALATEATLCGCPAVFLPNPHLKQRIATNEAGTSGIAWGTESQELERAKSTVHLAFEEYLKQIELFWAQLERFTQVTQKAVAPIAYDTKITKVRLVHDKYIPPLAPKRDYEKLEPKTFRQKFYGFLGVVVTLASEDGIWSLFKKVFKAISQGGLKTIKKRALNVYYRS